MIAPTWILVSARMASSRRPGKALAELAGRPLLEVLLDRMRAARAVDGVALITSTAPDNDVLDTLAGGLGVPVFRGSEEDVLRRHVDAADAFGAEHVVRVTGDNPLTDVETVDRLVALHHAEDADYTYVPGDALLMGILPEVMRTAALRRAWERGEARHRSELTTLFFKEHPEEFRIATAALPDHLYRPQYRLTVDEPEDVRLMQEIFSRLATPFRRVDTGEAIALLDREPRLAAINAHLRHRPANLRSVALDAQVRTEARERTGKAPGNARSR